MKSRNQNFSHRKNLNSPDEIKRGIGKLKRRIDDLKNLEKEKIKYGTAKAKNVTNAIESAIEEIFGTNSIEYRENHHFSIWYGSHNFEDDDYVRQEKFERGIPEAIDVLEGLINRLNEKLEDYEEDPKEKITQTLQGYAINSEIYDAAVQTFSNRHYSNAVFEAAKKLINLVKEKSKSTKDGQPLMYEVFSRNSPVLAFNRLEKQTDFDEQEGMMHLFVGCVAAIRNPRGHDSPNDSPQEALDSIIFISMLANKLEKVRFISRE